MNFKKKASAALAAITLLTAVTPSMPFASGVTPTAPSGNVQVVEKTFEVTDVKATFDNSQKKFEIGANDVELKDGKLTLSFKAKESGATVEAAANELVLANATAGQKMDAEKVYTFADQAVKVAKADGVADAKADITVRIGKLPVDKDTKGTVTVAFKDGIKTNPAKVTAEFDVAKAEKPVVQPKAATELEVANANNIITNTKVQVNGGKVYLVTPDIPAGLKVLFTVRDSSGALVKALEAKANTKAATIELGAVKDKVALRTEVKVTRAEDGTLIKNETINFNKDLHQSKPVINYAYVIDGALVLNATADAGMGQVPLFWKYSNERDWRAISSDMGYGYSYNKKPETNNFDDLFGKVTFDKYRRMDKNDYRLPIDIPSRVQIVFMDALGNKTPIQLDINKDNVIIKATGVGQAPAYVEKLIKAVTTGEAFDNVKKDNLAVVRKDTSMNLYETFLALIQDTWNSYNSRELNWESEQLAKFDPYNIKFDREGRYVFTITKNNSDKVVKFTVLVMDGKNNIVDFKIKKDATSHGDTFKGMDAMEFKTSNKEDANPVGFYLIYNKDYYKLTDKIKFKDNETKADVVIVDILNNREYKTTIVKSALKKMSIAEARAKFSDISRHWAENKIVTLVANGVISGYPDGTFKPENKITVRETLAIIGRYAQTLDASKVRTEAHKEVEFTKAQWGNEDVEWVLKRLPVNIFIAKNLDTEINREETAYVMNHVFNYAASQMDNGLTDLDKATYQAEIKALVAAGTISGYPNRTFKPQLAISRAELVSMMFTIPGVSLEVAPAATTTTAPAKSGAHVNVEELNNLFK